MPLEYNTDFKIALIIPAFNEDAVIGQMLAAVPSGMYEMVVVSDNGSTDATADAAYACGATVVSDAERGYGAACLRAIAVLPDTVDAVVFMQADLSETADEAESLLAPIRKAQADLVIGSRVLGHSEPGALLSHQKFGNNVAGLLIRLLFRHRYTDLGPYRAIRLDKLRAMGMCDRNYGWTVEMQVRALQQGLCVVEVPVSYRCRQAGVNKVSGNLVASVKAGWKIVTTILKLYFAA